MLDKLIKMMYSNKLMRKKKTTREKWQKITRPTFTRTLQGFERPDYTLDINGIQRNSIPTSDRITVSKEILYQRVIESQALV